MNTSEDNLRKESRLKRNKKVSKELKKFIELNNLNKLIKEEINFLRGLKWVIKDFATKETKKLINDRIKKIMELLK